jgi:hypothetical protein
VSADWAGAARAAMTPYAETEALLAVLEGDSERVRAILADMLPGELIAFADHVDTLSGAIFNMIGEKREVSR